MYVAEACLLEAVRNKIRTDLTLRPEQCDVELDDQIPAIATNDYYAVTASGIQPGPRHKSSAGTIDVFVNVRVALFRRVPEVARDRRRNVYIDLLKGIAGPLDRVARAIEYRYEVLAAATTILTDLLSVNGTLPQLTANETGEWVEPFRSTQFDTSARMVYREPYDAAQMAGPPGDPIVAISRGMVFQGARYMQVRQ